jgi:hypothetical protein
VRHSSWYSGEVVIQLRAAPKRSAIASRLSGSASGIIRNLPRNRFDGN